MPAIWSWRFLFKKKIEVIIVEHIAYEGHEDAELK